MENLSKLVSAYKTCAIAGHGKPDGDCVGSCMALYNYLRMIAPELEVKVYLEEMPPSFDKYVAGKEAIRHICEGDEAPELFFALDCGDENRVAVARELMDKAKHVVCIDHHISNKGYGDDNRIEPKRSSTSEILFEMITEDGGEITKELARLLYLGIMQDTGVFQYPLTSARTMEIGGILMSKGIEFSAIVNETFFEKTYKQNRILGKALIDSKLYLDGKLITSLLDEETMNEFEATPADMEGIVSQLRNTEGTEVSVFGYHADDGRYKISLRSRDDINVSAIAETFGGGGHVNAAGFHTSKDIDMIMEKIVMLVKEQLDERANG